MNTAKPFTFDRVSRILITAGVIAAAVWLLGYLSDVLIPFAVAFLLAYLMNPLVSWIEKRVRHRTVSVFLALLLVITAAAAAGSLVIPVMAEEIGQMGQLVSRLAKDASLAERAARYVPEDLWASIKDMAARRDVQEIFQTGSVWNFLEAAGRKLLPGVWGLVTGTAGFLMGLIGLSVIGLYLVFLLIDYGQISQGWKELLPAGYREPITEFVSDFESAMSAYFRGQAAVAAICGVLFSVGLFLVGLPLAILLGLFLGLLNMVPYLQILGAIPAVLLAMVHAVETGTSVWLVLGLVVLVFVVVQVVQDAFLVPRIMGKVTGMNPAMILLSLSVWGKLLGLLGLIIALPMTYLLLVYYRRFLSGQLAAGSACKPSDGS
ncbi:MAG: AI-2E family transporter [Desulfobacterales bacterium]|nr:AI-2E family transporter [Desulfobacterales bacterium]